MSEKLTDEMIEQKLADAINDDTPDMLDDLMAELGISDVPAPVLRDSLQTDPEDSFRKTEAKKTGWTGIKRTIAACAAVLVLMVVGNTMFSTTGETFAVVGLDVNPSIEISIDENEKVIKAEALNSDGEVILDGMKLKGTDVKTACSAIVGSMLANGYITDASNSVLVSVRAGDPDRGKEIEREVSGDINSYFSNTDISAAILGEYIEDDDDLDEFAEMYGISLGKAWLIRSIAAGSSGMAPEELAGMSTQELVLLAEQKHIKTETQYGSADTSKYIGAEKAIDAALSHAGLSRSQVSDPGTEFDTENGVLVYEVEFIANGKEYEYNINASDGKVVSYEIEDTSEDGSSSESQDEAEDDDDDD